MQIARCYPSFIMLASLIACSSKPAAPPPPPPPDAAAIRTAIDAQNAKFGPLVQAKDADGMVAMFTDDGVWVLPDASTFTGKAAILAGAKGFFDSLDSFAPEPVVIDKFIVVNDSEAVTFAHGIGMLKMKGGKKAERHINPFADYWKKGAAGGWRVAYEVNADGLAPQKKP